MKRFVSLTLAVKLTASSFCGITSQKSNRIDQEILHLIQQKQDQYQDVEKQVQLCISEIDRIIQLLKNDISSMDSLEKKAASIKLLVEQKSLILQQNQPQYKELQQILSSVNEQEKEVINRKNKSIWSMNFLNQMKIILQEQSKSLKTNLQKLNQTKKIFFIEQICNSIKEICTQFNKKLSSENQQYEIFNYKTYNNIA